MKKDTIYVDIDDEITSITDKLLSAKGNIIALVLPKRCTVLQSSVNMKILNKTAEQAGKKLVLITSESSLLPLAGAAGIFVAKTLQSKPSIPVVEAEEQIDTIAEGDEVPATDIDPNKSIGELAGATAVASTLSSEDDDVPIELGEEPAEPKKDGKTDKSKDKSKKDKKLKVPNFDKFRTGLFLIIGGVLVLIVLWVLAEVILPKATIAVTTQNQSLPVSLSATGSPSAKTVDATNNIVPATLKTDQKSETQQFTATGQQNNGNKASGTVSIYDCSASDKFYGTVTTVPAGTAISAGGLTFITQKDVNVSPSNINFDGSHCQKNAPAAADVIAQNPGDNYNLGPRSDYTVAGFASMSATDTKGMGGGTNNIVTVVSQSDCDGAKNTLLNAKTDSFKNQLSSELSSQNLVPIKDTFALTPGTESCSPAVGQPGSTATATVQFSYTMMGVDTDGINQLITAVATKQIQGSQSVIDTGINSAQITVTNHASNGDVAFDIQTNAQSGIKQDATVIAKSVAGKKYGDSMSTIQNIPGVSSVKINYSPFWVSGTPKNVKHITVKFINNGS